MLGVTTAPANQRSSSEWNRLPRGGRGAAARAWSTVLGPRSPRDDELVHRVVRHDVQPAQEPLDRRPQPRRHSASRVLWQVANPPRLLDDQPDGLEVLTKLSV